MIFSSPNSETGSQAYTEKVAGSTPAWPTSIVSVSWRLARRIRNAKVRSSNLPAGSRLFGFLHSRGSGGSNRPSSQPDQSPTGTRPPLIQEASLLQLRQQRAELLEHLRHHRPGNCADQLGTSNAPIEALDLVGKNDTSHRQSCGDRDFEGITFDPTRDRTHQRKADFRIVCRR